MFLGRRERLETMAGAQAVDISEHPNLAMVLNALT